jgi:RNA polymerase sigma factor (sigma-70 family)
MHGYHSSALAGLAAQLRRGPNRLRLRQLHNIEFLLTLVEPQRRYPFDFICHTLTGYRPRRSENGDALDAQLVSGEALCSDLVLMAEDLSADSGIRYGSWPERLHTVSELAQRFDVSTKTIFRWHRRGLVGWRARFPDRRLRLVFPDRCVRRFVAVNSELVQRGSTFSQLSAEEREAILVQARAMVETEPRITVNGVAKAISASTGRAVETIRLLLKQHDLAHPKSGLFNRAPATLACDEQSTSIWEAYRDGVALDALARRFERPIADVYRVVREMRARELIARTIEFVSCDDFLADDADERILKDPAADVVGPATDERRIPRDLPPYIRQLFRTPLLSRETEFALFRRFNYLKYKADAARKVIDPQTVTAAELDRIEALLDAAAREKQRIVQANLRLVVSIAKRHLRPTSDFYELVSDGNVSLMRAVDKFDFTRGFKFSTYASWAIIKNFARTIPEHNHHRDRYQTGHDELLQSYAAAEPGAFDNEYLPAVRGVIDRMLGSLDERESEILRQRYGLAGAGGPQTLEQVGRNFGVSKERVRQLETRAMAKLRSEFQTHAATILGG